MKKTFLALALAAAPAALAQELAPAPGLPAGVRVLHEVTDEVKLDDGTSAMWHFRTTYDPATGITEQVVTDESGRVVRRDGGLGGLPRPSEQEIAAAEALIRADPELAALIAAAPSPEVSGGFILMREEGHPCGPGSRCLQFDVMNVDEAARRVERLRYVVVDLREGRLLSRDFDPAAEGNSANPAEARSYN